METERAGGQWYGVRIDEEARQSGKSGRMDGKKENHVQQSSSPNPPESIYHPGQITDDTVNSSDGKMVKVESKYVQYATFADVQSEVI